jgi:hypothetical protein
MTKTQLVCDACGKPIDPQNNITFAPVRGGLNLTITTAGAKAGLLINTQVSLCDGNCVNAWLADIKPTPAKTA